MTSTRIGTWASTRKIEITPSRNMISLRLQCTECAQYFEPSKEMRDYAIYMGRKPTDICLCQPCLGKRFEPEHGPDDYDEDELN